MESVDFVYYPPELLAMSRSELPVHRIDARIGDDFAGFANLVYRRYPSPHFYLREMIIVEKYRRRGLGSKLLGKCNDLLDKNHSPGVLKNIIPTDHPAHGIYQSHGWKEVDQFPGWYTYGSFNFDGHQMIKVIMKTRSSIVRSLVNYYIRT